MSIQKSILKLSHIPVQISNNSNCPYIDNKIEIRDVMLATLSADHRVGDGAEGAIFMNEFRQLLQKPSRLLL